MFFYNKSAYSKNKQTKKPKKNPSAIRLLLCVFGHCITFWLDFDLSSVLGLSSAELKYETPSKEFKYFISLCGEIHTTGVILSSRYKVSMKLSQSVWVCFKGRNA